MQIEHEQKREAECRDGDQRGGQPQQRERNQSHQDHRQPDPEHGARPRRQMGEQRTRQRRLQQVFVRRGAEVPDAQPVRAFPAPRCEVAAAQPAVLARRDIGLADPAFRPSVTSRKPGSGAPAAIRYSSGLRSPSACPPLAIRYCVITAAKPAQIGADCDVPPPTSCCWLNTICTPVNGSATAATSGVSRRVGSLSANTDRCHSGLSNKDDTPPPVPCDSGTSNHACSACHTPLASVDSVVPPTSTISGSEAIESSPTSLAPGGDDQSSPPLHSRPARSPLALNAVVPWECAVANAVRAGARSAAVISLSQPQPIEKLHIAPGNWRSASSSICPIFS